MSIPASDPRGFPAGGGEAGALMRDLDCGVGLMAALVDDVALERTDGGTRVRLGALVA